MKVAKVSPALSLKASGSIDMAIPNSPVTVTPKITGYHVGSGEKYTLKVTQSGTNADVSKLFSMNQTGSTLTVTAVGAVPKGYTYTALISADLGKVTVEKSVKLPVKWSDANKVPVSVTLKAAGSVDVIRPDTAITLTPAFKNWFGFNPSENDLVFYKNKAEITGKVPFTVTVEDGKYVLTNNGADSSAKYTVAFRAPINGQVITSKAVSLAVKMGKVTVTQSTKTVKLLKNDRYDSKTVQLTLPEGVSPIDHLGQDGTSAALYTVTDLGNQTYRIAFRNRVPAAKAATIKLNVYLRGNLTNKPNATVSVKVTLQ